jgi:apolipoprotein N-acyltransferase
MQLSAAPGAGQVTHLIWPETAVPFYLDEVPEALRTLGALVPEKGALITGTLRRTHGHESAARGPVLFFNSLAVVAHDGRLLGMYDKAHLVPFGEYTPFQDLLTRLGVPKVISGPSGFSSGSGPQVLTAPGVPPFQPLICYEVIFPGVTAEGADRAQWLVNVTNDAWFGTSAGPYQHLAEARVRAIEQGLPLVRAANTGISAVIDPYGHIHSQIPLGQAGVIDSALPKALEPTLYNRFGNRLYLVLLLALTALGLASPRRK